MDMRPLELERLRKAIYKNLKRLDDREKYILISLFGLEDNPKQLSDIAHEFGVGTNRVSQIRDRALRKLRHPANDSRTLRAFDIALSEGSDHLYSARMAQIFKDLGDGYFLGDDSYDDDDGFTKEGYTVYYQEGDDQFRQVSTVSMSPYSNPPGHVENEIRKIIASDQNNLSESIDYLDEK
jgi:hypothetical protein